MTRFGPAKERIRYSWTTAGRGTPRVSSSPRSGVRVTTSTPSAETRIVSSDFAPPVMDGFHASAADAGMRVGSPGEGEHLAPAVSRQTALVMVAPFLVEAVRCVGLGARGEDFAGASRPVARHQVGGVDLGARVNHALELVRRRPKGHEPCQRRVQTVALGGDGE